MRKKTLIEWREQVREKHGERLDVLRFSTKISKAGKSYLLCCCSRHGEFEVLASSLLVGGCASCWAERRKGINRLTEAEWFGKFRQRHGDRYVYQSVNYKEGKPIVTYFCEHHGSIEQPAQTHIQKSGCPKCGNARAGAACRLTTDEWLDKFRSAHGQTYSYIGITYVDGATAEVSYICNQHGEVKQNAKNHSYGTGCPKCHRQRQSKDQTFSLADWSARFHEMHGKRYEYIDLVRDSTTYILYRCSEHGETLQTCADHARGFGCAKCTPSGAFGNKHTGEILDYITSLGLRAVEELAFKETRKRWDIAIPTLSLAIEFDGLYFHSEKFKSTKTAMLDKANEASKNGYRQINIFEDEWYNKRGIVEKLLAAACGKSLGQKVHARKTLVSELLPAEARNFLDKNSIDGGCSASTYLGLKYQDELVACIAYSYVKKSTVRETERYVKIHRYATAARVVGGFQKLLSAITKTTGAEKIISYSDPRLFSGGMYAKAGFRPSPESRADYCYIKGRTRFSRQSRQKSWFKDREGVLYDPSLTESELATLNGYYRLWFRGRVKWTWVKPQASSSLRQADSAPKAST